MNFDVKKELKKWQERVIYDVRFKEGTEANLARLDEMFLISMEHFVTIAANSEPLVYKIGRYFIEKGDVENNDISLLDGQILESYMGDDSVEWRKKERIDDFFKIFGTDYRGKWVIIPLMEFDVSIGLAVYLMTQFKKCGATGLICYADGANNLIEVISKGVEDRYFFEFPEKRYKRRSKKLIDDKW
jgi:hypothetical protein